MSKVFNFLFGSVLGGLVGATVALLMAPTSGTELRNQMQNRAQNFQTEVKQAATARRAELEKQLADLRTPRKS